MTKILTPRSAAALAVVAASFFLMVAVAQHGGASLVDPHAPGGLLARTAGALVQTVGAGVWVLLLLPIAWGVIVYFQERTPDLLMRFVGTVLLAVSTSTIAGLLHVGPWAGHVGNGVAGALGGLSARMGGFGTAIAWTLALAMLGASFVFATDWCFHAVRRASRAAANETVAIAEEPLAAELLEDPAEAQPREFVVETPRAAVAAAEMADIVSETSDELVIPGGWEETEDEGRTVISAPSGYRGVEFLPESDELAVPGQPTPRAYAEATPSLPILEEIEAESAFEDEHFVTTPDAAFFVETPSEDPTEEVAEAEVSAPAQDADEVADAVETLFAAVTTPEPVAAEAPRASGIGLPEESPFLDEFFAVDAGWPYAPLPGGASDGASAASEMASSFAAAAAPVEPAPAPAAPVETPAFIDEDVSIDEILVSRIPAQAFDDEIAVEEGVSEDTSELFPSATYVEPAAARPTVSAPEPFVPAALSTFESASAVAVAEVVAVAAPVAAPPAVEASPVVETPVAVPEAVAAPAPVVETAPSPQLTLFAETAPAVESMSPAAAHPELDLSRLHAMELDPLFHDAVAAILERGRASAVVLQRHLGIGYARGIRILDQMTAGGLVGPDTPTGVRELRVTKEQWASFA